jgi:hypothetical protein
MLPLNLKKRHRGIKFHFDSDKRAAFYQDFKLLGCSESENHTNTTALFRFKSNRLETAA